MLRRFDGFQRRHGIIGFPYAVVRKYLDDEGAKLAALITYYGFLSVFPLLLLAVTILTEILTAHPSLQQRLIEELVAPRLRTDVKRALEQLPPTGVPLLIGAVGLLLSGTGGVLAVHNALNRIWAVPRRERFALGRRYLRVLLMLLVLLLAPITAAAQGVLISAIPRLPAAQRVCSAAASFTILLVVLVLAHKVLTARKLRVRQLWVGSVLGAGSVITVLDLGAARMPALVARSGPIYGSFAAVVAIFTVLYLVSQALVFSAEICSVQALCLSPRTLVRTAPTEVDVRALTLLAQEKELLPGQRIGVTFEASGDHLPERPA
ncbi:MAG: YihY/virulence factor BrkB family protein [Mycobacterium leprae]